jgi:hypothetical protein
MIGIAVVLGHIVATQWLSPVLPPDYVARAGTVLARLALGPLTGTLIAQLLLLTLTLASLCKYVTRIVCYRRGY